MPGERAYALLDALRCPGCGDYLGDDAGGGGFPQLCAACNAVAAPKPRRLTKAQVRRAARSATEPMCCPYCARRHRGKGLAAHLHDVHCATMTLVQEPLP